jgi:hypothetical protein
MSGYGVKRGGEGKKLPIVINKDNAISKGRYINNIEYRKTDKAEFLTIEVIDKAGMTARKSFFPPKMGTGFVKTQADFEKEQGKFNRVMKNLTNVLLSTDYETGEVATFEAFCNKIISDIGKSYYNKELRIKLVYDKKNWPTLPNYPTMFEDPTKVSDGESKMTLTQWDKVEPTVVEMDKDVPITEVKKEVDDGLPF